MVTPIQTQHNVSEAQNLIDALYDVYSDEQLSKWEMSFVGNIIAQLELGEYITDAQLEKLHEICDEYVQ
jgi:hypothetical protein